ncbi:vacuolar sorting protein 39 domain 2-domain-containing protein [Cunninghamella echinulata]|nr:vacuolar sorting protein 39 domain 2-domain-containing protein [Cunninghamella echinulata]
MPPLRTSSLPQLMEEDGLIPQSELEEETLDPQQLAERRQLFFMLLKTYLAIEDKQLMLARTLHLLNTQGYYLDVLEVLSIIPEDWPLQRLQGFLMHSLRRSLHDHREGEVVLGMSRGENILVSNELIDTYRNIGPTKIDESTICRHCHFKFTDDDEIVQKEHNQLYHFRCAQDQNIIPVENHVD